MEPLETLRARIAEFPGYDTILERRRSDEYVRSYLGEALTEMAAGRTFPAESQRRIEALVLRVAFADPKSFPVHAGAQARSNPSDMHAVTEADAATVELADQAAKVDAASAARYLDEIAAALDERDAALRAAALKTP